MVGRERELHIVQTLLDQARSQPAVLVVDGEPGIGKTTLCLAAAEAAEGSGFTVLTASGAAAEVSLAWAALADLLGAFESPLLDEVSPLHRQTLQTLISGLDGLGSDERLIASAFRAALEQQSRRRPVLIVVDDAQWLDDASRLALGFAIRRLNGPIAVIVAYRSGELGAEGSSWANPADPQAAIRMTLGPLSLGDTQTMVAEKTSRALPRSALEHIHAQSGGNPFYALELARAAAENRGGSLPPTLAALVSDRIGELDPAAAEALTTVAAAFEPTVDVVAEAIGCTPADLVDLLHPLEARGVVVFDGPRIKFTHPLIASGVTGGSDPAAVRRAHRRLAAVVAHPESRARHLALCTTHGDPDTLAALDAAADNAASRGAFSTAAELVTTAIRLGGDDHMRRLRGAEYHFRAGALDDCEALITPIIEELPAGVLRAVGLMLIAAARGYREGMASTIGLFDEAVRQAEGVAPVRTQALLLLSLATGIGGDMSTCVHLARQARDDADATGLPELKTQALSLWSHVSFMHGLGVDTEALRTALEMEDPDTDAPVMLRPTPVYALNCAWTGRLDEARTLMTEVLYRCEQRGTELDALWATEQLTWIDIALGRYDDAEQHAAEALQRARQIGGQLPLITAHTAIANAAAYRGRVGEARVAAELAAAGANAAELGYLADPPLMSLAFAEVSDGQYEAALQTLKPLLEGFDPAHGTEIMAGAWLPDAVEALTALGRADEAETFVVALEANGSRNDRPWMLAIGARSRALIEAARGDLDAALLSAERAMTHHTRLPMPFERARTQLLLGQLQRRRRRSAPARANITGAAAVFSEIGSPLWAARAQRELDRLAAGSAGAALTDSERQVAERAAAGLSNKEIATALFLSGKTVEMHLSNTYRKLGIRSRAQLAERLREQD